MIKVDKQHHKVVRISPSWGAWEYTYYERHRQLRKAHDLMEHSHEGREKK